MHPSSPRSIAARLIIRSTPAETHGRYLLEIPDREGPHPLLLGFHGYAENAEIHLEQLRRIPDTAHWAKGAVQGLHLFYRRSSGEVIASWMTRLNREQAIEDNIRYVRGVLDEIRREPDLGGRLVYAGFSQGAAMAYRAAARAGHPCHGLLLLGGDVPPDVKADASVWLPPILLGRGRNDPWYTQEKMDRDLEILASRSAAVQTLVFEGGHEWTGDFLHAAGAFLQKVSAEF